MQTKVFCNRQTEISVEKLSGLALCLHVDLKPEPFGTMQHTPRRSGRKFADSQIPLITSLSFFSEIPPPFTDFLPSETVSFYLFHTFQPALSNFSSGTFHCSDLPHGDLETRSKCWCRCHKVYFSSFRLPCIRTGSAFPCSASLASRQFLRFLVSSPLYQREKQEKYSVPEHSRLSEIRPHVEVSCNFAHQTSLKFSKIPKIQRF